MKCFKVPWTWTDSLAQPKQWKKDMRFESLQGRHNQISSGGIRYKLDLWEYKGLGGKGRDIK